jgi:hypothetical protein
MAATGILRRRHEDADRHDAIYEFAGLFPTIVDPVVDDRKYLRKIF